jgi:hypothetical protein
MSDNNTNNSLAAKDIASNKFLVKLEKNKKIENIKELVELLSDGDSHDCFILLNANIRSSKSMFLYEDGTFSVINEIDWSEDKFTFEELSDPNNYSRGYV